MLLPIKAIDMFRSFLCLTTIISFTSPAWAQDKPNVEWEAVYIADIWHNQGGVEDGTVYLDNFGLAATTELPSGIEAHASLIYNNGKALTELTGDSMAVSNIETGVEALRLYEAWLSGNVTENTNLKFGFFDLNSEFDVLESASLFMGGAHGMGMDIGQTGENGPSIFPVTGLALRAEQSLSDRWRVRGAMIEGTPGDPNRPKRTTVKLGNGEGALLIGELERSSDAGKILVGAWAYTAKQAQWDGTADSNNTGIYLRGETVLKQTNNGTLTGFGRIGWADDNVNEYSGFASLGLHYARDNGHEAGIGIAHASASEERSRFETLAGGETAIELTYALPVHENLIVQPNFQYVISPSADPLIDDAAVFGLRLSGTLAN